MLRRNRHKHVQGTFLMGTEAAMVCQCSASERRTLLSANTDVNVIAELIRELPRGTQRD